MAALMTAIDELVIANRILAAEKVYDAFGHVNQVTVTPAAGQGQTARTSSVSWGSTGRKPPSRSGRPGSPRRSAPT